MNPLSPVDALAPAFSRARTVFTPPGPEPGQATPFRFWFFIKIVIAAALTQGNIYFFFIALALEAVGIVLALVFTVLRQNHQQHAVAGGLGAPAVAAIALGLLFILAIGILVAWLWCRLRFTLFDLVVYRHGLVGRAWAPYAAPAWRFLGLMILVVLGFALVVSLTAGPFLVHMIMALGHMKPQEINSDPTFFFVHIFPLYGIFFAVVIVACLVNAIAQDFVLPPMALENAPLGLCLSRFFHLLRNRFWHVALYLLLRIVLGLGMAWVGGMAIFIVLAIFGSAGFGLGFLLYHTLWHAVPAGPVLFVTYCIFAGLLLFAVYFLGLLLIYGVVAVVMESYAVCFYASYYPPLGDRLAPTAIPPVDPSPTPPAFPAAAGPLPEPPISA
jgi:hypothetical protein